MTENRPKQHGGHRPGAGRKPSLKPLAIIRLLDPDIRAALVALTVHQRQHSGNPQLSQEQVVADLILAAQRQLEKSNNQDLLVLVAPTTKISASLENTNNQVTLPLTPPISTPTAELENTNNQMLPVELAATAAVITTLRQDINTLVAALRTKSAVGQRDGKRLMALLHQLIDLHAAQIAPWAMLEELNRSHNDDADRDQAIASLRQRPLVEYRQDGWIAAIDHVAAQLATGPIRRQADQWNVINLAVEISGTALVTNERIADLIKRLQEHGINPIPWLDRDEQAPTNNASEPRPARVSA